MPGVNEHRHLPPGSRTLGRRPAALVTAAGLSALIAAVSPMLEHSALADPPAFAARTTSLQESGNLHATSKHGFTLNERGTVAGTLGGTIYVHLTVVSSSRVTAEVNLYAGGSSISGHASASYRRASQTGTFSGSISIDRGTGRYAHVRGSGLSFSGTIRRSDDAVTVRVSGTIED